MNHDFNGSIRNDQQQTVCFSDAMDWQSVSVHSDNVTIIPNSGGHHTGSSQIKFKTIVNSAWDTCFHWGNLVATHHKGQYFAYALTVPGHSAGMVRVIKSHCSDRILIKGFQGHVRDLSFAFHGKRILIAAVDELGYLLVHEIVGTKVELILQVNPDPVSTTDKNHRIVWCPYVPENLRGENDEEQNDAEDQALLLASAHDNYVEVWHLGIVNGIITAKNVSVGAMFIKKLDNSVVDVAFSPDSTAIAIACLDGYVRFFLVNVEVKEPQLLHSWQPHDGKQISRVMFLDNLSNPNSEGPLWKWAITLADYNTELKLWSCEQWKCHQTIQFKTTDSMAVLQKVALDLSATFLLISDIKRKVLYVMIIEQTEEGTNSKISNITQLLLPCPVISLAVREATLKSLSNQPVAEDEEYPLVPESDQVVLKLLVVQPKSVQKCKAIFQLGTSLPLGDGGGSSYSQTSASVNTSVSEYEASTPRPSNNHLNLLTPAAFISPAKSIPAENNSAKCSLMSSPTTPASMPLPPPTPNEILALSSPRKPSPEVTSSTTPPVKRNGIQSGGSSPSREVEEILGTRPITEGSIESPDTSSATVPSGSALQDAIAAYPPSISPAFVRTGVLSNQEATSTQEQVKNSPSETSTLHPSLAAGGSLMEFIQEVLANPNEAGSSAVQSVGITPTWPTMLPPRVPNRVKENPTFESELDTTLQTMQQSLSRLVELFHSQQDEYSQLRSEVSKLREDLNRMEISQTAQPSWVPQLESTFTANLDRQQKKIDEINASTKLQQVVAKLQTTIRSELETKAHTLEQRSLDFVRKELHSVIAAEVSKMEPILRASTLQLLTHIAQNKNIMDSYSQATSAAAVTAMNKACKDTITLQLLPSLERSFHSLFTQLHDTFTKGIGEFMRGMEGNLERHRRLQEKEAVTQFSTTVDKMRSNFDQVRDSISTDTKAQLRKMVQELPDHVTNRLIPLIQKEVQRAAQEQKAAFDGALLAVQQVAHVQTRAATPALSQNSPLVLQTQLKQLINQGLYSEAFQRALSASDLNMVLFVCGRVDPQTLFAATPCVLPQPVLLSLIQQLSADLGTATELKVVYLQEAVLAIDFRDPITKEHAPNVMAQLVRQLQQVQLQGNPPLSRQIRMLLMGAQSLQKS